jgi:hypothetical protein
VFDERFSSDAKACMREISPLGAFAFPFLKPEFCRLLDEELEHFEVPFLFFFLFSFCGLTGPLKASGMPMSQPNSMHSVGLILAEIGLTPLVTMLRRRISSLCDELYPQVVLFCVFGKV